MKDDYLKQLNQLKTGALKTIKVSPKSFMDFQAAFMEFESRKRVVGIASLNGNIIYHFDNDL